MSLMVSPARGVTCLPPWPYSPITIIITGGEHTYVPGDVPHDLALGQRGDTEAVVPVSPAEEQLPVGGHGQRAGAQVGPGGKGALQEALGPVRGMWDGAGGLVPPPGTIPVPLCPGDSLGVGDSGVFGEAEVVGDVLVVGQPVMGPQQAVGTHGDLGRGNGR